MKGLANGDGLSKSGPSNAEIVILDSDDEDEGQVKRELSPSAYRSLNTSSASVGSLPPRSQTVDSDIIDLTLDTDDEDTVVSLPNPKKRKSDDRDVPSPTEQIWKKSRMEVSPTTSTAVAHSPTPVPYSSSSSYSPPSRDAIGILQPPSPSSRYNASGYASRSAAPTYPSSAYIPPGGAPVPVRAVPPYTTPPSYLGQPNGSSSSSTWRT